MFDIFIYETRHNMTPYHKIPSIWKRQSEKPHEVLVGEFKRPEFEYLYENEWRFTEKVDGTNIRVMWDGHDVSFAGRTDKAEIPKPLMTHLTETFHKDLLEKQYGDTAVTLYGEGYGAGIQKGGGDYISDGVSFILFDIKVGHWWLERDAVSSIALDLGIPLVPFVVTCTLNRMVLLMREAHRTTGWPSTLRDTNAEGVVGVPLLDLKRRSGERIIVKLKAAEV